ncbi:hypothetical protein [Pleomorphomonas sp. NRK KF1]|uniref:hypothetical protein n=1 Tax=Pleomorphomonas sp. NRK KF1 TaxID=2943000 RepID=UPI0020433792|nr:hypothetical protein [Pleomorphomonas sp. NRK KF1]MCM5555373.1 hypothetical protein [Pleomorphomonas sp. NRK KF1]
MMRPTQTTPTPRDHRRATSFGRRSVVPSRLTGQPLGLPGVPSPSGESAAWPSARRVTVVAAAALLGWAATLGAAPAQESDGSGDIQPARPCVARPDDQAKGGEGTNAETRPQASLDECNGVLVPPKVGDQEMPMDPPDKGKTPVIPPGAIPAQPPE